MRNHAAARSRAASSAESSRQRSGESKKYLHLTLLDRVVVYLDSFADSGMSTLLPSIENSRFEIAVALLETGVDPNDERTGYTALRTIGPPALAATPLLVLIEQLAFLVVKPKPHPCFALFGLESNYQETARRFRVAVVLRNVSVRVGRVEAAGFHA